MKSIAVIILVALIFLVQGCMSETQYSHCVIANTASAWQGEWLKNNGNVSDSIMLTKDCESADKSKDGGDGEKAGLVRWATCLTGPDCDEAGVF